MMKTSLAALLFAVALHGAAQEAPVLKPWSAARYHGLTVGTSTRTEVLKTLGEPVYAGKEEDTGTPMMTYEVSDPMPGTLVVYLKKNILDGMRLDLHKSLTKGDVVRILGPDYVVVHYATDDCIDNGGTSPLYQDPHGPIKYMEYRASGLAASFAYNDDLKVDAINFTFKPFGPPHSLCAARAKTK